MEVTYRATTIMSTNFVGMYCYFPAIRLVNLVQVALVTVVAVSPPLAVFDVASLRYSGCLLSWQSNIRLIFLSDIKTFFVYCTYCLCYEGFVYALISVLFSKS